MAHNVLIERRTGSNQDPQGRAIASPGPPQALPGAGDGAGIAVEQADIQRPNIDAKLQRRGGHNALQISGPHFRFRVAPLAGNIAAPVGSDTGPMPWITVEDILEIFREHFDHQTTLGEDNRLTAGLDGQPRQTRGLRTCRRTHAELSIDHRRIPQQQVLFPLGCATLRNRRDLSADELPGQFHRVGYGSRAQDKHGVAP